MSPPTSDFFAIEEIPNAGRGVVASQDIPAGTPILDSERPAAAVVFRQYRKEVCASCFAYDRGRVLPVRDNNTGKVFCSIKCQSVWMDHQNISGLAAWQALHTLIQARTKAVVDLNSVMHTTAKPSRQTIDEVWGAAEKEVEFRKHGAVEKDGRRSKGRRRTPPGKLHIDPDILGYLLAGVLTHSQDEAAWEEVLELAMDSEPYKSAEDLEAHSQSFVQLASILPDTLSRSCTASVCRILADAGSHNAFGIRSGSEDGEEYMGYALYPSASYFNHSCNPNILKRRIGSSWEFWSARDIAKGEQCCISYLGGDERDLTVSERRSRLQEVWGFVCVCDRCVYEDDGAGHQ